MKLGYFKITVETYSTSVQKSPTNKCKVGITLIYTQILNVFDELTSYRKGIKKNKYGVKRVDIFIL